MNKHKWIILCVALAMIAGTAGALTRLKANQRLGLPGIKTTPIPGSQRLDIFLPEQVLHYTSTNIPTDQAVLDGLPQDTSFAQRYYISPEDENDRLQMLVVLMGADRTSIHKPQFCLRGSGWDFDDHDAVKDTVRVSKPAPYDLPVMKIMMNRVIVANGHSSALRGIFVYWFVADHRLTEDHWVRMRESATHLLATGELQRWAYIGCMGVCLPGDEEATYQRMKNFIAASIPEFQLATGPQVGAAAPTRPN